MHMSLYGCFASLCVSVRHEVRLGLRAMIVHAWVWGVSSMFFPAPQTLI